MVKDGFGVPVLGEIFSGNGSMLLYGVLLVLLLVLNALFVACEFAMVKVRPAQIEAAAKEKGRDVSGQIKALGRLDRYLSASQLGITLSSLALGFLGQPLAAAVFGPLLGSIGLGGGWLYGLSLAFSFAFLCLLHVVLGELVPRSVAIRHSVATTQWLLPLLRGFDFLFGWLINGLNVVANWILRKIFRVEPLGDSEHIHSSEELAVLVAQSGMSQEVTETEREILINALELNDLWVRDVMTPRSEVVVLDADEDFEKTMDIALRSKHTRFPLVKGHLDQSIGLIHIKDLFKLVNDPDPDLMRIKRDLKLVPDTMPLDSLLKFFLKEHAHLALVVDEFGTPVGIVFLDNVIEELVGDIQDEFDNEPSAFVRVNESEFVVEGSMTLNDLEDYVPELVLESGEVTTVGGYVTQLLGRFPQIGETLDVEGYEAKVTSTDGRRVGQVHFRLLEKNERDAGGESAEAVA